MPPSSLSYTARRHLLSAHTHRYLKSLTHISALLKAFLFVPPHRTCSQLTETSELVKVSLSNIHSSWLYSDAVLTSMESECGGLWDKREFVGDVLGAMEVLCDGTWGGRHSLGVKWDAGKNEEQPVRGELTDEGEKERIKHTLEVGFCEKVLMSKCIDKLKALPGVTLSYTSTHLTLIHPSYAITLTHISPRGAQLVQWTLLDVTTYVTLDGRGGAQSSQVVELDDRDREGVRVVGQMVLGLEVLDEEDLGEAEVSEDSPDAPSPRTTPDPATHPLLALHHHLHLYTLSLHLTALYASVKSLCKTNAVFGNSSVLVEWQGNDNDRLDVRVWERKVGGKGVLERVNAVDESCPSVGESGSIESSSIDNFVGVVFVADPVVGVVVYMTNHDADEAASHASLPLDVCSIVDPRRIDPQKFVSDVREVMARRRAGIAVEAAMHDDVFWEEGDVVVMGDYGGVRVPVATIKVDRGTGVVGKGGVSGSFNQIAVEDMRNVDAMKTMRKQIEDGVRAMQETKGVEMGERAERLAGVKGVEIERGVVKVQGKVVEVRREEGEGQRKKQKVEGKAALLRMEEDEFVVKLAEMLCC